MNQHEASALASTDGRYVVVLEQRLSSSGYGAAIWWSEPMTLEQGSALLGRLIAGEEPSIFKPAHHGMILRVSDREYLNVWGGKLAPKKQSRLTLTEVVSGA